MPHIVQRNDHIPLLVNAGAAGDGQAFDWLGGPGAFYVEGTLGGSTVKLQVKSPNDAWLDVGAEVTKTAAGVGGFDLPPGDIRASIAGGAPVGVFAYVRALRPRGG